MTPTAHDHGLRRQSFGADFHPTSLYGIILDVPDVHSTQVNELFVNGKSAPLDEQVRVPKDGLVYGVKHHVIRVVPQTDY